MKQIPLAMQPEPDASFDSFVPGANAAALAHLRTLAASTSAAAPVYLWGAAGTGKTHLLRALAGQQRAQGLRVGWFDAADRLPWELSPEWSLVVVDRCEALDPAAQHAAFALFVDAMTHLVQFAAAGRLPPVDLALRDDLRTRLAWGHVHALRPLAESETRAALRRDADRRGIFLSDEVMDYLLTRFPRDLAHLLALLDRLDGYGLALGRRVTVPLLRQMLAEAEPVDH
ncbi:Chromosomal replication initiator protein DnaA [Rubrivivax sp. A210]|uniref:DnaA regulatory inactivator Hda n=1 Tax=Rubrivivax sp. A210 TaxID=2772301 RepID=UPI001919B1CB|nr:DnaA regulatory inactivator Hda [Rubrivivax sp. A210]CAD5373845.1 Chromosomal replication initiator protein DnaA [Rubrivivax sp. A210]